MLDTSCDKETEEEMRSFIGQQPGVEHIDLFHTRQFGNKIYVDLEIAVNRNMPLYAAHEIAERVHSNMEREYPNVKHVMIHVNPVETGDGSSFHETGDGSSVHSPVHSSVHSRFI